MNTMILYLTFHFKTLYKVNFDHAACTKAHLLLLLRSQRPCFILWTMEIWPALCHGSFDVNWNLGFTGFVWQAPLPTTRNSGHSHIWTYAVTDKIQQLVRQSPDVGMTTSSIETTNTENLAVNKKILFIFQRCDLMSHPVHVYEWKSFDESLPQNRLRSELHWVHTFHLLHQEYARTEEIIYMYWVFHKLPSFAYHFKLCFEIQRQFSSESINTSIQELYHIILSETRTRKYLVWQLRFLTLVRPLGWNRPLPCGRNVIRHAFATRV